MGVRNDKVVRDCFAPMYDLVTNISKAISNARKKRQTLKPHPDLFQNITIRKGTDSSQRYPKKIHYEESENEDENEMSFDYMSCI